MANRATTDPAEIQAWIQGIEDDLQRDVVKGIKRSTFEAGNRARKRAPRSARGRRRGGRGRARSGGAHLAQSITEGFIRRGSELVGFVGTNLPYSVYTEIKGRNRRINVGTPEQPTTDWAAKRKRAARGQPGRPESSMPWLSAAQADVLPAHMRRMRAALKGK